MDTGTVQPPVVETSTNNRPGGVDPRTGMVESKFIAGLRNTLMPDGNLPQPWPPRGIINDRAKLVAEMTTMFRALFLRFEKHLDIPRGPANSALRVVSDMLKGSKWPLADRKFPLPAEYNNKKGKVAFRRYEITCAMALFYQALHGAGGGGVPTDWPPKDP